MVYILFQKYSFFNGTLFLFLLNPMVIPILIGITMARKFDFKYTVEEAPSREAWADRPRKEIENYDADSPKYPFGLREAHTPERVRKEIQCQKE